MCAKELSKHKIRPQNNIGTSCAHWLTLTQNGRTKVTAFTVFFDFTFYLFCFVFVFFCFVLFFFFDLLWGGEKRGKKGMSIRFNGVKA